MAVRRVSDLPNLDVVYPGAELSDCLFEVSYAAPDNPRRYQSFYENVLSAINKIPYATQSDVSNFYITIQNLLGNYLPLSSTVQTSADIVAYPERYPDGQAIMDYIKSLGILSEADLKDLGIDSIKSLLDFLNALLNRNNLFLFVAQSGVPANVVTTSTESRYEPVNANLPVIHLNGGKTIVWKQNPTEYVADFNTKYYTARKHDIIFFKTIADAVRVAQNFKFLEGAKLYIFICTNLIEQLTISYRETNSNIQIEQIQPKSMDLTHSDMCELNVCGLTLQSIKRQYVTSGDKTTLSLIDIQCVYDYKVILRDAYSLYNARYYYFAKANFFPSSFQYLIFDSCNKYAQSMYDKVTFSNYLFYNVAGYNHTGFEQCAFLNTDYSYIGSNVNVQDCSFVNCSHPLAILGGSRSTINNNIELISCDSIYVTEGGFFLRNIQTAGTVYIKNTNRSTCNYCNTCQNGNIATTYTWLANADKLILSANTKSSYTEDDWKNVAFEDVMNVAKNPSLSSSLTSFAMNPYYNNFIGFTGSYNSSNQLTGYKHVALKSIVVNNHLSVKNDDFIDYMKAVVGDTNYAGSISPSIYSSSNNYYQYEFDGSCNNTGIIKFYIEPLGEVVAGMSNAYDNYETDRFNPNSRIRSLQNKTGNKSMHALWDNLYYHDNWNNLDGNDRGTWNLNEYSLPVYVYNDPENNNNNSEYYILNDDRRVKPGNNPNEYGFSLKKWRKLAENNNYSFTNIPIADFNDFKNIASSLYGYNFIKR